MTDNNKQQRFRMDLYKARKRISILNGKKMLRCDERKKASGTTMAGTLVPENKFS